MQGLIFDIKRFALHDGTGIRTTVFFKGCPLRCPWCHNPESQKKKPEKAGNHEIIGKHQSVTDIMKEIEKEIVFYDESGGGVTFSGGEPLEQPEFLRALLKECKKKDIHTSLDTTGCVPKKIFNTIIDDVDLFLYDLKIMDEASHIRFTGQSNKRVIDNLKTLAEKGKNVIVRFPVIPGFTDSEENIKAVGTFVSSLDTIKEIHLLPYHDMAAGKYRRLGKKNKMSGLGIKPPTAEHIARIKNLFARFTAPHVNIKEI